MTYNVFHLIYTLVYVKHKNLSIILDYIVRNASYIFPILYYKPLDNRILNSKKTIFLCSHDYIFSETFITYYFFAIKYFMKNKGFGFVTRKNFEYIIPGFVKLETSKNLNKDIINLLNNNGCLFLFYSRNLLYKQNLHKLVNLCEYKINLIPIRITNDKLLPISHNNTSADIIIKQISNFKYFDVNILDPIEYDSEKSSKEYFIKQLKYNLYPDCGFFDKNDNFIKGTDL